MSISLQPDIYQVKVDENGTYVDNLLSINDMKNGIQCPCGTRKNHIFTTPSTLKKHFDCEKHKIWLNKLNLDKINHYNELIKNKVILDQQKKQIIDLKLELQENNKIIINLNREIMLLKKPIHVPTGNLLDL